MMLNAVGRRRDFAKKTIAQEVIRDIVEKGGKGVA
jgi:hypothetical protein